MWIINPCGRGSGSLYVCLSFLFFLVCSFPLPVSNSHYFTVVCLLAFLCDSVWPLVNPFLSQLVLVEHSQITITNQTPTPLSVSFCCSSSLFFLSDFYMPYTMPFFCVSMYFFAQTISLFHFFLGLWLISFSSSSLFLDCVSFVPMFAHECLKYWCASLCLMRTVDRELKTKKIIYFNTFILDRKRKRLWHSLQTKTQQESSCQRVEGERGSGREGDMKDVMTFKWTYTVT